MPPKGVKATTSGPSKRRREDVTVQATFFNAKAADHYKTSIVHKRCIPERGITLYMGTISDILDARKWHQFACIPTAALVPVVREFYANAREQHAARPNCLQALVRGQTISFNRSTINRMYNLEDIEDDEYSAWLSQEPDYQEVINLLAKPGTVWKMRKEAVVNFERGRLKTESKAWHYFISGKLLPTNHYSHVTKDRALLNFAIQSGYSMDVGKVIEKSIISHLTGKMTGGLGHPSLIYALCVQAGVPTLASEELQHPSPAITLAMLSAFDKQESASEEAEPSAAPSSSQPPPPEAHHRKTDLPSTNVQNQLEELRREQRSLKASMQRRMDHIVQEHRLQFNYLVESTQILAAMLQSSSMSQSSSSVLPSPPQFASYPPPSSSSEESEEEEEDEQDDD